nr:hypothetical protein [Metabacillus bambusae]
MECIFDYREITYTTFALDTFDANDFYKEFDYFNNKCMTQPLLTK